MSCERGANWRARKERKHLHAGLGDVAIANFAIGELTFDHPEHVLGPLVDPQQLGGLGLGKLAALEAVKYALELHHANSSPRHTWPG